MPTYRVCGLRLSSGVVLPELCLDPREPEVEVHLGTLTLPPEFDRFEGNGCLRRDDGFWLSWPGLARARVRAGEVRIEAAPDQGEDAIRPLLLGPILSVVLAGRGLVPLHASALAADGRAFCLAADSGVGKSTLAEALHRRGHAFVCDDVAALEAVEDEVRVHPGFPQLKLAPETLTHLGESWEELPRVTPFSDKRARRLEADALPESALPLDRIYVLEDGPDGVEGPLASHVALLTLLRHVHRSRMIQTAVGVGELMQRCARIASRVPVFRLRRSRSLDRLDDVAARLEAHLAA